LAFYPDKDAEVAAFRSPLECEANGGRNHIDPVPLGYSLKRNTINFVLLLKYFYHVSKTLTDVSFGIANSEYSFWKRDKILTPIKIELMLEKKGRICLINADTATGSH
jgi:hypothetical protein